MRDLFNGHPQGKGHYHYHGTSPCLPAADTDTLVGRALYGHPITGKQDAKGRHLTNADPHGRQCRAETINESGLRYGYAYRVTDEYPKIMVAS